MHMSDEPGAPTEFRSLLEQPRRAGIFLDFDGTLAPIVDNPRDARPVAGAVDVVNALAKRFGVVALISGRPLSFLRERLPLLPSVRMFGLYGLQSNNRGRIAEPQAAAKWRSTVDEGATTAQAELPKGVRVERKGLTFVLHYRTVPEHRRVVEEWAAQFAAGSGLDAERGRLSIEIGPFHGFDKGAAVSDLADGLRAACVFGDDAGDLPAFRALTRLSAESPLRSFRVAVRTWEAPTALLQEADHYVDGPEDVVKLLRSWA